MYLWLIIITITYELTYVDKKVGKGLIKYNYSTHLHLHNILFIILPVNLIINVILIKNGNDNGLEKMAASRNRKKSATKKNEVVQLVTKDLIRNLMLAEN